MKEATVANTASTFPQSTVQMVTVVKITVARQLRNMDTKHRLAYN